MYWLRTIWLVFWHIFDYFIANLGFLITGFETIFFKKAMVQCIIDCYPFVWVYLKHLNNQILQVTWKYIELWVAEVGSEALKFGSMPFFHLCFEFILATYNLIKNTASWPNINLVTISLIFKDFWGNIGWGATEVEYEFVREDDFGEAEINNLNTFEAIGRWVHLH